AALSAQQQKVHQAAEAQRTPDGRTALMLAAQRNRPEVISLLLSQGDGEGNAALLSATDRDGRTSLMLAAASGAREAVDALLRWAKSMAASDPAQLQSQVCATDRHGMTPLMHAASSCSSHSTEILRALVEA